MRTIILKNGGEVLVDDKDFEALNKYSWWGTKNRNGIVAMANLKIRGKWVSKRLHTLLLNPPRGMVVDHINHDTLDNRRSNLRVCTRGQNRLNSRPTSKNKSGFKGVEKVNKKWRVRITVNGKRASIGMFSSINEAVRAYNAAAVIYHKEFAYLNKI